MSWLFQSSVASGVLTKGADLVTRAGVLWTNTWSLGLICVISWTVLLKSSCGWSEGSLIFSPVSSWRWINQWRKEWVWRVCSMPSDVVLASFGVVTPNAWRESTRLDCIVLNCLHTSALNAHAGSCTISCPVGLMFGDTIPEVHNVGPVETFQLALECVCCILIILYCPDGWPFLQRTYNRTVALYW